MLQWKYLAVFDKNVATIFQWKNRNISDMFLQYSVLCGYDMNHWILNIPIYLRFVNVNRCIQRCSSQVLRGSSEATDPWALISWYHCTTLRYPVVRNPRIHIFNINGTWRTRDRMVVNQSSIWTLKLRGLRVSPARTSLPLSWTTVSQRQNIPPSSLFSLPFFSSTFIDYTYSFWNKIILV